MPNSTPTVISWEVWKKPSVNWRRIQLFPTLDKCGSKGHGYGTDVGPMIIYLKARCGTGNPPFSAIAEFAELNCDRGSPRCTFNVWLGELERKLAGEFGWKSHGHTDTRWIMTPSLLSRLQQRACAGCSHPISPHSSLYPRIYPLQCELCVYLLLFFSW